MTHRTLTCPGCAHEMHVEILSKVEVDRCARCDGMWFDVGEVARAALCDVPPIGLQGPSARKCPLCRTPLTVGRIDEVEVDHCETCQGTYLDAGELGRLRQGEGVDAIDGAPTPNDALEPPASQELRLWALLMGGTSA